MLIAPKTVIVMHFPPRPSIAAHPSNQPNRIFSLVFIVVHFIHLRTGCQRHFEKGRILFLYTSSNSLRLSLSSLFQKTHCTYYYYYYYYYYYTVLYY